MIDGNLAYNYVIDVPWDKNPSIISSSVNNRVLDDIVECDVGVLPVKDLSISFNDDRWDFNTKTSRYLNTKVISYLAVPSSIKTYVKFYVLYHMERNVKISTLRNHVKTIAETLRPIFQNTTHTNIKLINNDDINSHFEKRDISQKSKNVYLSIICKFFSFLKDFYMLDLAVDMVELQRALDRTGKRSTDDETRTPDIPKEYFNKIYNKCIEVMNNSDRSFNNRMMACSILIMSQTGLRINDFLDLQVDSLYCKKLNNINKEVYYLHYTARKPTKANQPLLEFDIYCTDICARAVKTMLQLRKDNGVTDVNYLYVSQYSPNPTITTITSDSFICQYNRWIVNELPLEAITEWEGIAPRVVYLYDSEVKNKAPKIFYIPMLRQYRVHCCTELYNKGVPLEYIRRYMGHLSEAMMGYYVRPKDTYQENIMYSEKIIKEIVDGDLTPLGGNLLGEGMKSAIKKFIDENNFNIKNDIADIVKAFGDKVVIRGKTGGVCIKTSLMPCAKDARSNDLLCAYNLCPNLFHFFYMIDVTYQNFTTLKEACIANANSGNKLAAQKELNKLKDMCRRKLIPELDELGKELERKGVDTILEQYPSLLDIIQNKEIIREEIELWMNK